MATPTGPQSCPWPQLDRDDHRALAVFFQVAPLAEYGLAPLAVELMPDLRLSRAEADGLRHRLLLLAEHQRLLIQDRAERHAEESPRPRGRR